MVLRSCQFNIHYKKLKKGKLIHQKRQNVTVTVILSAIRWSSCHFFLLTLSPLSCSWHRLYLGTVLLWDKHGWEWSDSSKTKKTWVFQRNNWRPEGGEREWSVGGLRSLTEACLRVVVVLGRNNLNNTKVAVFHGGHPLSLPWSPEGSEGETANKRERGVDPSHHCPRSHIRETTTLLTLLLHFPYSLSCGFCLTRGLQVSFITHLTPLNCSPAGGVYEEADRMLGPPADQSLLFMLNMLLLTVTFSTPIGLTSQTHARLGLQ